MFLGIGLVAQPVTATVEDDLCVGSPCVVREDITVDAGAVLDYSGRSFVVSAGTEIRVGDGAFPRGLTIVADDIRLEPGAKIIGDPSSADKGDGDGGRVQLESLVGDVTLETAGSNRSRVDVSADRGLDGGVITIRAFADAVIDGQLLATAQGDDVLGGDILVEANGSITFSEDVFTSADGDFAGGGDIGISAGDDVVIGGRISAAGGDDGGGEVDIVAAATVSIDDQIILDGGDPDGEAGGLAIEAGLDVILGADGILRGRGGAGPEGDCGDGVFIDIIAGGNIDFYGDVDAKGGAECFGGDQEYGARLDFIQHAGSEIVTETGGGFGGGPLVEIVAGRSLMARKIDASAKGFGGLVTLVAPLSVTVLDKVTVRGSGNPLSIGGRIDIESCTVDVLGPDGDLDARSADQFDGLGSTFIEASGLATISGRIRAAEPDPPLVTNVGNFIRYRSTPPVITGSVSPDAIETLSASLPECGYCGDGVVQPTLGEVCDDGGIESCDGCAGLCGRVDDVCGDGFLECGEECDDGNLVAGDGCEADCTIGPVLTPTPTPTPVATPTPTPVATPTPTPVATPTPTPVATPTPTPEATPVPTETPASSPTPSVGTLAYVEPGSFCGGNVPCFEDLDLAVASLAGDAELRLARGTHTTDLVIDLRPEDSLILRGGWTEDFSSRASNTLSVGTSAPDASSVNGLIVRGGTVTIR